MVERDDSALSLTKCLSGFTHVVIPGRPWDKEAEKELEAMQYKKAVAAAAAGAGASWGMEVDAEPTDHEIAMDSFDWREFMVGRCRLTLSSPH